jgi:hypothetical protein
MLIYVQVCRTIEYGGRSKKMSIRSQHFGSEERKSLGIRRTASESEDL